MGNKSNDSAVEIARGMVFWVEVSRHGSVAGKLFGEIYRVIA